MLTDPVTGNKGRPRNLGISQGHTNESWFRPQLPNTYTPLLQTAQFTVIQRFKLLNSQEEWKNVREGKKKCNVGVKREEMEQKKKKD